MLRLLPRLNNKRLRREAYQFCEKEESPTSSRLLYRRSTQVITEELYLDGRNNKKLIDQRFAKKRKISKNSFQGV